MQIICKQLHRNHRRLPEPPLVAPAVCNSVRTGLRSLVRPGPQDVNESLRWWRTGDAGQDRGRSFVDLWSQRREADSMRGHWRTESGQRGPGAGSLKNSPGNEHCNETAWKPEFLWVLCGGNTAFDVLLTFCWGHWRWMKAEKGFDSRRLRSKVVLLCLRLRQQVKTRGGNGKDEGLGHGFRRLEALLCPTIAGWRSRNRHVRVTKIDLQARWPAWCQNTVSPRIMSCCQPSAFKHWQQKQHLKLLLVQQTLQNTWGIQNQRPCRAVAILKKLLKLFFRWIKISHHNLFSFS